MDTIEATAPSKEDRMWAMLCHLGAAIGYMGAPIFNVVVPLVVWILKKDTSALVDDQGKEAVNANISFSLYLLIAGITIFVGIGLLLVPVVYIAAIVLSIIGGVKANDGIRYRYPAIIRFIK